jgi:ring-1,2-phenylacetyl-CoA epoxidase subunit PaaC
MDAVSMSAPSGASIRLALTPPVRYVLRIGDTALVHAQRLAEWCGHGPVLEEDIALTNMALDLIGQARSLLTHAARLEAAARGAAAAFDEDQLAFWRDEDQFLNLALVEQPMRRTSAHSPGGDFADTVLRNFLLASWFKALWQRLASSTDAELAAIAGKAVKEARYHQQHAAGWVLRLGDGTEESAARMRAAVDRAWPYTAELFAADDVDAAAEATGLGPSRAALRAAWLSEVGEVLDEAGLAMPPASAFVSTGTRGAHSEHLGFILAEMQSVQRRFPGGRW